MARVIETSQHSYENPGPPDQVIAKFVAMGWEVEEQQVDRTTLKHDLIPGSRRTVLHR